MADSFPINGERYLRQIIDRIGASKDDVVFAEKSLNLIKNAQLEEDYYTYQMRTTATNHHSVRGLFEGKDVEAKVLAEVANLAEMDIYLVHKRNNFTCNLTTYSVREAIDLILRNAGVSYRRIPKGDKLQASQLRALYKAESFKNCKLKLYTIIKVLYWLDVEIALQFNAERAARNRQRLTDLTKYIQN